jgi:hypothetical protein
MMQGLLASRPEHNWARDPSHSHDQRFPGEGGRIVGSARLVPLKELGRANAGHFSVLENMAKSNKCRNGRPSSKWLLKWSSHAEEQTDLDDYFL